MGSDSTNRLPARLASIAALGACIGCAGSDADEVSFIATGSDRAPLVATAQNGDSLVVFGESHDDGTVSVSGVQLSDADGNRAALFLGANGLPRTLVGDGVTAVFSHWTEDTVDIALTLEDGAVHVERGTPVDADALAELRTLAGGGGALTLEQSLDFDFLSRPLRPSQAFRYAGLAISLGWCAGGLAALLGGVTTMPAVPLIVDACGGLLLELVIAVVPEQIGTTLGAMATVEDLVKCKRMDAMACLSFFVGFGEMANEDAERRADARAAEIELCSGVVDGGSGDVQVTLAWNAAVDLDLWVTDPNGERIFFGHPTSVSGGALDIDDTDGYGPENIFWPFAVAPRGRFTVQVNYFSGDRTTEFQVITAVDGIFDHHSGTLAPGEAPALVVTLDR